ncbi:MAG: hypothetical protein RLZZ413_2286, partial [Pseudomonadota bacterium]
IDHGTAEQCQAQRGISAGSGPPDFCCPAGAQTERDRDLARVFGRFGRPVAARRIPSRIRRAALLDRAPFLPSCATGGTGCGRGEIGRRTRFRFWRRKAWGFKSLRPHHRRNPRRFGFRRAGLLWQVPKISPSHHPGTFARRRGVWLPWRCPGQWRFCVSHAGGTGRAPKEIGSGSAARDGVSPSPAPVRKRRTRRCRSPKP